MKISFVYEFLTETGGIERLMANNAKMLQEAGFDVEILTCHYNDETLRNTGLDKVKVKNISTVKTPRESLSMALCFLGLNKIKENKSDLFISYSFPSNYLIGDVKTKKINFLNHFPRWLNADLKDRYLWAKSTYGIKRMVAFFLSILFGKRLRTLDKSLVKNNDLIITSCNYLKKKIDPPYKINAMISYPPVDRVFKESKEKVKEKFILYSGRIIPDKKFDWLIEACSYMKNKVPLYLSGQGNEAYINELKAFASKKGVKLKFLGKLSTEDLIKYYSSAQLTAFPVPVCEYGMIAIEALACGTPSVVWGDNAGPAEQIIDGVNGFYAKPYDLKDFGAKMDKCIDSNLKQKNREKIKDSAKKFSYEDVKAGFVREIKKVLEDR
jgi:glycosyltransferase involved in cell wall biosynthesis